jgi:type II secretory pathway pseudopilin PulG
LAILGYEKNAQTVKGFTLVEMILYVAICSGLLLSLSLFLTFILGQRIKNQIIADVNQQGQQAMWMITQTVRNGRSIDVPVLEASGSSLSITTVSPVLNPTIFDSNGSSTLEIKEGVSAYIPLTNSHVQMQSLVFQNVSSTSSSDRILKINFTLQYKNLSGSADYSYSKSFSGSATLR